MHAVTMLQFETDRSLHEVRILTNGNVLGSLTLPLEDNQTILKLAAAISEGQKRVTVYLDTIGHSTDLTDDYPPVMDARDTPPREHHAPDRKIQLPESGWLELYRVSAERFRGADTVHYELKVEIR
jgi:hypothetical protein